MEQPINRIADFGPGSEVRLTKGQGMFLVLIAVVLLVVGVVLRLTVLQYLQGFVAVSTFFFCTMIVFSLYVAFTGVRDGSLIEVTEEEVLAVLENPEALASLPVISIIVAAYKEAAVVNQLVQSLSALVYPEDKFQVLVVLEERDYETIYAFETAITPGNWKIVVRPHAGVKTKPAAMNYLLQLGLVDQSDLTVVFDAEDLPSPYQLVEAVIAFEKARTANSNVVCIQARLEFSQNATEGLLQRMLNMDYLQHFGLTLPGLSRAGFISPLGGTSNYIFTKVLLGIGGWDEKNVTEDMNLAVMLARLGYQIRVLDSVTGEEAVGSITAFVAQRSRWIKGGIQTYFRHMRNPVALYKDLGGWGFLSFQLVVGAPLVLYLINPLFWGLTFTYALTQSPFIQELYPPLVFYAAMVSFSLGNFMYLYLLKTASFRTKQFGGVMFAFFAPFYWFLLSIAGYKAFWEFAHSGDKAQTWAKTEHKGKK